MFKKKGVLVGKEKNHNMVDIYVLSVTNVRQTLTSKIQSTFKKECMNALTTARFNTF